MRVRILSSMLALVIPALLAAQGGIGGRGGGMGGRGGGDMLPRQQKLATAKEIETMNPARLLLDKRKKLAMPDSQATVLLALQQRIYERNASTLAVYDSMRREIKIPAMPSGGMGGGMRGGMGGAPGMGGPPDMGGAPETGGAAPSDEEMAKLKAQLEVLQTVVKQLRERRQVDVTETLALVTPDQSKKAIELIGDQNEAFDKLFPRPRDLTSRTPREFERERR